MLYNIFTKNETMIHYIKFDKAYVVHHIYNLLMGLINLPVLNSLKHFTLLFNAL